MGGSAEVRINRAKFGRLVQGVSQESASRAVEALKQNLMLEVYRSGRVRTGEMAHKWASTEVPAHTRNGTRFAVWSPVSYTKYQDQGTRGSRPNPPRKALRFRAGGKIVFAKKTRPITAAHFMERALGAMTLDDWLP